MRAHGPGGRSTAAGPAPALLVALACLLGACAALAPRIEPPSVSVNDVVLERIEGAQAWFAASVTLVNPNARAIAVEALEATLALEGEPVATFALAQPVTLPAHGAVPARITARTGFDALLRGVASAMRHGTGAPAPMLRYDLSGQARLAGGLALPFHRSGEIGSPRAHSP